MSKSKVVFALCMVAFIAGCAAKKDDAVYADGAAVSMIGCAAAIVA